MADESNEPQELRLKMINKRKELLARTMPQAQRVRVVPRDDDLRLFLKHPSGVSFPESGSAEWPLDKFTNRRIAEGAVSIEGNGAPPQQQHSASHRRSSSSAS